MKRPMLFSHFILFMFFLLTLSPLPLLASDSNGAQAHETAKRLQEHLINLTSLSFNFTQQTKGQMSGRPRQASGQAFFIKDENGARMRWNYSVPDRQIIISDGVTVKMYFEKLNQMIVTSAKSLQEDVTYSFFTGEGKIEENFIIGDANKEAAKAIQADSDDLEKKYEVIKLVPRAPTSQVNNILLWIDPSYHIRRILIRDTFDTLTQLNLSNIEENSLLTIGKTAIDELFSFTPPKGTEIIQQ